MNKLVSAAGIASATPILAHAAVEVLTDIREEHKTWIEVPCIIGADINVAQNTLSNVNLNHSLTSVRPKQEYSDYPADTVVSISHNEKSKVDPSTTITLYYITQNIIDESKQLVMDYEAKKAADKQERKAKVTGIKNLAKDMTSRISIKPLKNKIFKKETDVKT